jgi:hypothetical protein
MASVNFVKAARKDYPEAGIKKGESYYWWSFRFGGKHKSKYRPKPSQLTQSEFMSAYLSIQEQIEEWDPDQCTPDDFISGLIGDIDNLKGETEDKLSNMPEGLQEGDTGQLMQERIDSLEEWQNSIESIDVEADIKPDPRYENSKPSWSEDKITEITDEIIGCDPNIG